MNWTMPFQSYLKLMRVYHPSGIWLLMFPSWWGLSLASPKGPPLYFLFLFACGAFFMRSAGCVYNDLVDKDFDRHVKRTATRPLATGEISTYEALGLLLFLLGISAIILFSLPFPVILTGVFSLSLVLLYPWMKRLTYWPQIFLGLTFNMGILMGWLCLAPQLSLIPFLFYGGAIFWTLGYDTIYALQDKEDDLLAGIKSAALVVGSSPKIFLSGAYGLALALWGIGGQVAQVQPLYWLFFSLLAFHFFWQVLTLNKDDPQNCMERFRSNKDIGILLFLGIVFSHLID